MEDTLFTCDVTYGDGDRSLFISHHPRVFVEWPLDKEVPETAEAIDNYMGGMGAATVPMKYTRGWLEGLNEAQFAETVTFGERKMVTS